MCTAKHCILAAEETYLYLNICAFKYCVPIAEWTVKLYLICVSPSTGYLLLSGMENLYLSTVYLQMCQLEYQ